MPRDAASVILFRTQAEEPEIYLVLRSESLRFFGGYHAFPGGRVDEQDSSAELQFDFCDSFDSKALKLAAIREVFEETGVLLTQAPLKNFSDLNFWRKSLLDEEPDFSLWNSCLENEIQVDPDRLIPITRLLTPKFSKIRFDTRFYLCEIFDSEEPEIWPGELTAGIWESPKSALERWNKGELQISAPTLTILRELKDYDFSSENKKHLSLRLEFEGSGETIPWTPGIEVLPLYTPPLPPESPTNAFLVGTDKFYLIDPGPKGEAELDHLGRAIQSRVDRGDKFEAIILSHHHVDHTQGLKPIQAQFRVPVWAHPITEELMDIAVDRILKDGDLIDLGVAPDGYQPWQMECLFTPGHAKGHLAFYDSHYETLIAGDLVSTILSMYVGSPGGHMKTYLDSLKRIEKLSIKVLFPSHGPATLKAKDLLTKNIAHRKKRTDQIHSLLPKEPTSLSEIAHQAYSDIHPDLVEWFLRATRATLEYLVEQGKAVEHEEDVYSKRA